MSQIYIDRGITQSRVAVFDKNRLVNLYLENHNNSNSTGNIYKGRVENVVDGLKAAFVNVGTAKNALLHFDDRVQGLKPVRGQEVIVQVIREGTKEKGPRVTERISIPGKYIILLPDQKYIGISKKITEKESRETLRKIAYGMAETGFGLIMRTEALETSKENIVNEYNYLKGIWRYINEDSKYITPPYTLFNAKDFYSYILREFIKNDSDFIYLNREEDMGYLKKIAGKINSDFKGMVEYTGQDFSKTAKLDKAIQYVLENRLSLPSGGFLVIDKTEALVSIDVNTGQFTGKPGDENAALETNLEACEKIYEIVTLKNLSGIILIDFIDMKEEKSREAVIDSLKNKFKEDSISNRIYGFTALGLLEMARARKGKRISELVYEDEKNKEYNTSYILKQMENNALKALKHYRLNELSILISPELNIKIQKEYDSFKAKIKDTYGIKVNFKIERSIKDFYIDNNSRGINPVKVDLGDKIIYGRLNSITEKEDGRTLIEINKIE